MKHENEISIDQEETQSRLIPSYHFNANTVLKGERYEVWREGMSCIFAVDADKDVREEGFQAEMDTYRLGPLLLSRTSTLRQKWKRTSREIARDGMDHYMIQLFSEGTMAGERGEDVLSVAKEALIVFDLAHEINSMTTDFENLSVVVPRRLLSPKLSSPESQHMRVLTEVENPIVPILIGQIVSLVKMASRLPESASSNLAEQTVNLISACLNVGHERDSASMSIDLAAMQMTRARSVIENNLGQIDLNADMVAKMVGVSRSRLYEMFEPHGGVASYMRERRIYRAHMILNRPDARNLPIYDLALQVGFSNASAFGRAFKKRYNMTPAELRYGSSGPAALPGWAGGHGGDWLHNL